MAALGTGTSPTEEICTSKLVGTASLGTATSVRTYVAAFAMKLLGLVGTADLDFPLLTGPSMGTRAPVTLS